MKWNWQTAIKARLLILNSAPKWYLTILIVALEFSHTATIERMSRRAKDQRCLPLQRCATA
jgi:hypothetical protein